MVVVVIQGAVGDPRGEVVQAEAVDLVGKELWVREKGSVPPQLGDIGCRKSDGGGGIGGRISWSCG